MRGFLIAACLMAVAPSLCAGAHADDLSFRLLTLEGRNVRWAVPENGLPATVTYAFVTHRVDFPGARNCDAMTAPDAALAHSGIGDADFRREVRAAFDAWEAAANIKFQETASTADSGILIGSDAKARGRAFTNVALRDDSAPKDGATLGAIRQSLICLNPQKPWKIGFDGNLDVYDLRYTIMHEIGHAIGLDHPSPQGRLMSFRYVETTRDLTSGDAAGAVALYGRKGLAAPRIPATATPAGQTTHGASGGRAFGLGEAAAETRH